MTRRKSRRQARFRPARASVHHFATAWVDGGVIGRNPSQRGVYWSACIELGGDERPVMVRKRVLLDERPIVGYPPTPAQLTRNDEAEWMALREALLWLVKRRVKLPIVIHSDSLITINQYNGTHACNLAFSTRLRDECRLLAGKLKFVTLEWKPRETMVRKLGH